MKSMVATFIFFASMAVFVACSSESGSSSNKVATTPQPCNNIGMPGASPNCQMYQNYYGTQNFNNWAYGAWYFPQQYIPTNGNCGCNIGYAPVSGPFGVACAPSAYFNNYAVITFNLGYWGGAYWNYSQNTGWVNMPQATYTSPTNSCLQSTAQGCDVRMNNCSAGSFCQAVAGGSTIGLCVQ